MALTVILPMPSVTTASPDQSAEDERDAVRGRQGEVALEIDALEAEYQEVEAALETLAENVRQQEAELEEAERAAAAAEEDLAEAEAAVVEAERRINELEAAIDEQVVEAYVNPPAESLFSAFAAESMSDAVVKQALIDLQSNTNADLFDQLNEAHEDLELERQAQQAIAQEAERMRVEAEEALAALQAALAQQERFVAEAELALEAKLAEAAALEERDRALSQRIAAEQAALARQLEAARQAAEAQRQQQIAAGRPPPAPSPAPSPAPPAAPTPSSVTPAPGGLATVSCPGGGSITVAGSVAPNLRSMLDAAGSAGVGLCGWGYRDPQRQIALRRSHCGPSEYAVWQMPASQCSPPTARPGRSMHEQGLAVDFTCDGGSIGSRGSPCFQWLSGNAASYGFYNLPSEPWHWSVNGN